MHTSVNYGDLHFLDSNLKNLDLNWNCREVYLINLVILNFVVNCHGDVQSPSHGNVLTSCDTLFTASHASPSVLPK